MEQWLVSIPQRSLEQSVVQTATNEEVTISLNHLLLCSLFPVSSSNCTQPLQPETMAGPLPAFFNPEKDPHSVLQNWVPSSLQIRALQFNCSHHGSNHCPEPPARAVPNLQRFLALPMLCSTVWSYPAPQRPEQHLIVPLSSKAAAVAMLFSIFLPDWIVLKTASRAGLW